jgi:hypothetical protein
MQVGNALRWLADHKGQKMIYNAKTEGDGKAFLAKLEKAGGDIKRVEVKVGVIR